MKGALANWIWIIGGIVAGVLVFTVAMSVIPRPDRRADAIGAFEGLYEKVVSVCNDGKGSRDQYYVEFPADVTAVYPSKFNSGPPEKVSLLISNESIGAGEYLCIQYKDENPVCEKIEGCNFNITYMGTPSAKPDFISRVSRLFRGEGAPVYPYFITLKKTDVKDLYVKGQRMLPGQKLPECNNGILEVGEECDTEADRCPSKYGACTRKACEECFCSALRDCELCESGIPTSATDPKDTDWCKFCSTEESIWRRNCGDGLDNDCDGFIDGNDDGC